MDTNLLGNGFMSVVSVVDKLALHARSELLVSWLIDTSRNVLGGRAQAGLAISLSKDVFALNSWNIASVT